MISNSKIIASINISHLIFTVSVPPPEGENEEERDRTETRGPLPSGPQITEHQARAALLAHVADRCCWGSGAAKKMAIAKINYDSAFHVSFLYVISFVLK